MLEGTWEQDIQAKIVAEVGITRAESWGKPDLSSNPFRASVSQLSVLYDRGVTVNGPSPELILKVQEAGMWELMQRIQRDTLGLREMLLKIDTPDGVNVTIRPVYPDMVIAVGHHDNPGTPVRITELLVRVIDGVQQFVWDTYDIRDPLFPYFFSSSKEPGENDTFGDLTEKVWGGVYTYPWWDSSGKPYLPYVLYHAQKTGKLWDFTELSELVEGSLNCAMYQTYFGHVMRQASWPQRYTVGVEIAGIDKIKTGTEAGKSEVTVDPTAVLQMQLTQDSGGQFSIGQWTASADPVQIQDAAANYERRVAAMAGISPADIQRVAGDPRSGHAIAITKEAQREAQRRFEPQFRAGDEELLRKAAAMLGYPEEGWSVTYHAIPLTPEEIEAHRNDVLQQLTAGLLKKEDAWLRLNPGKTQEEAEQYFFTAAPGSREYPVGYVGLVPSMLTQLKAGEISIENFRAVLVNMMGLTAEAAEQFK